MTDSIASPDNNTVHPFIVSDATATDQREDALRDALTDLVRAFELSGAALYSCEHEYGVLACAAAVGVLATVTSTVEMDDERALAARVARDGQMTWLGHDQPLPAAGGDDPGVLGIPVRLARRLRGVLLVACSPPVALGKPEQSRLAAAARALALGWVQPEGNELLKQRLRQMQALGQISDRFSGEVSLDSLLEAVVDAAVSVFGADGCAVYIVDPGEMTAGKDRAVAGSTPEMRVPLLDLRALPVGSEIPPGARLACLKSRGLSERYIRFIESWPATLPGRMIFLTGEPVYVPNVEQRLEGQMREALLAEGCQSVLILPMRHRDGIVGGLVLYYRRVAVLASEDVDTAQLFSNQIAIAIRNAQLLQQAERANEQLRASLDKLQSTQHQLVHSERMTAIGRVIAGVAHELNNPLTSVLGYSQLLMEGRSKPDQVERCIRRIATEADRCQKIVHSLLTFARVRAPEHQPVDINAVADSALSLRAYELRVGNIAVHREAGELPLTMGDFHQFQQVVFNLILNAEQAIRGSDRPGALTLRTRLAESGGEPWIVLEVEDTGPGIDEEVLPRIFEPFYTTKVAGDGTGLGLSVSYGIVQEHGGMIEVIPKQTAGACLRVSLPVAPVSAAALASEADTAFAAIPAGQKVLVVDDEEPITAMIHEVLHMCGCEVVVAGDGAVALELLSAGAFDIVVTDLMMPGLGGRELFERAVAANPAWERRFLFITGDIVARANQDLLHRLGRPYLVKPFKVRDFMRALRQCLET